MNKSLKTFAQKLRMSVTFASNKAVEYMNGSGFSTLVSKLNALQLSKGEDANRKDLGEYGAWRTQQRAEKGLQTDFIDLKFEGNFHESIFAEGELSSHARGARASLKIDTTSPEDWDAISEDSRFKDALGLNQENRDDIGYRIALEIQQELLKYYK